MSIQISSHGCEWAAENIAKLLKEHGEPAKVIRRTDHCDLKIMVGFYQSNNPQSEKAELLAATRRVIWWVGTDILWMEGRNNKQWFVDWINQNVHENWAEWGHSAERLKVMGIKNVRVVHMPTRHRYQPMPLPKDFTVGCYCYNSREGFYGYKIITEAARLTPKINWILYPRYRRMVSGNIEHMRRVSADKMAKIYKRMSCHVRIIHSDGMPQGPMEAAMCARPVIYNFAQLPYMIQIKPNAQALAERVRDIRDKQLEGKAYNWQGAEYWRKQNDPKKLVEEVKRALHSKSF